MTEQNPATPAQAAAPGSAPQVITTPPAAVPPIAQVPGQEGKVTIPVKEYRDLQRSHARALSFDKRANFAARRNASPTANDSANGDAESIAAIAAADARAEDAERRALQSEVRGKVADLLGKDEFKALPKSTRDLILKNPGMLSQADNIEEAMLDIEDFVRDQVLSMDGGSKPGDILPQNNQPPRTETPPTISGGAPASPDAAGLEDLSKLHGPARSQANIRNLMKVKGRK